MSKLDDILHRCDAFERCDANERYPRWSWSVSSMTSQASRYSIRVIRYASASAMGELVDAKVGYLGSRKEAEREARQMLKEAKAAYKGPQR